MKKKKKMEENMRKMKHFAQRLSIKSNRNDEKECVSDLCKGNGNRKSFDLHV